jgi:hypothetical protein
LTLSSSWTRRRSTFAFVKFLCAAQEVFRQQSIAVGIGFALRTRAEALLAMGDTDRAIAHGIDALGTFRKSGQEAGIAYTTLTLAKANMHSDIGTATSLAHTARQSFKRMKLRLGLRESDQLQFHLKGNAQ